MLFLNSQHIMVAMIGLEILSWERRFRKLCSRKAPMKMMDIRKKEGMWNEVIE